MLTLLMFRGANVNSVDKKDRRPIHYAAFMGKTRTAQKKRSFPLRISLVNVDKSAVLRICSHILKKFLMENFIFCAVPSNACSLLHKSIRCASFGIKLYKTNNWGTKISTDVS